MPQSLSPIPIGMPITDPKDGTITVFFRQAWQLIQNAFTLVPTLVSVAALTQGAAIATTALETVPDAALYRVSYYLRKTVADGVNSRVTFVWGWTEGGSPLTESAADLTTDTSTANQHGSIVVQADANTDLSYAVTYASNTPGKMKFDVRVVVERLA